MLRSLKQRGGDRDLKGELCNGLQSTVATFKQMKADIHVNETNKLRSYFTGNALPLYCTDQFINALSGKCRRFFWESGEVDKCFLRIKVKVYEC
jgi:hypothetical protein